MKQVKEGLSNLKANKERMRLLDLAQFNTEEALELRRLGYLEGVNSNLNYLESLSISFDGRRNFSDAKYDYVLSLLKSLLVIKPITQGTLNEFDRVFSIINHGANES